MSKVSMKARSATLAKGLEILNFIGSKSSPVGLRDVMSALDMTKPTAHRLLATLADYGLIRFDPVDARYRLGMRLFELSRHVWRDFDLRGAALTEMRKLHDETGETISLAILTPEGAVYIDELQSRHPLREQSRVGQRVAIWKSAMGKALVSGLTYEERSRLMARDAEAIRANARFPDLTEASRHLDLVNARGYAIEVDDDVPGISGVAAPIVDHRGITVAAVGLSGASERLDREALHRLGASVIEATRLASLNAGGTPRPVANAQPPQGHRTAPHHVLARVENLIGESPVVSQDGSQLLWVDICRPCIFAHDLSSGQTKRYPQTEMVTALADTPVGLMIAGQAGIRVIDLESGAIRRDLGHPEAHIPTNRFNDGRLDSQGRFWVGTLAFSLTRGAGALYRVDLDGTAKSMDQGLSLPNGIGWSPDDRHLYLVESRERCIYEYAFDCISGEIGERRVLIQFSEDEPGVPDGLLVAEDGSLWVAMWDGWSILRVSPDGRIIDRIGVPFPRPTSLAWLPINPAQPATHAHIAVTSARIRVSEALLRAYPKAGDVLEIEIPTSA